MHEIYKNNPSARKIIKDTEEKANAPKNIFAFNMQQHWADILGYEGDRTAADIGIDPEITNNEK